MQMQYTVREKYERKVWKSIKCAQLGCTVHCGRFKPVDIMVNDKTDSLGYFFISINFYIVLFIHWNNVIFRVGWIVLSTMILMLQSKNKWEILPINYVNQSYKQVLYSSKMNTSKASKIMKEIFDGQDVATLQSQFNFENFS